MYYIANILKGLRLIVFMFGFSETSMTYFTEAVRRGLYNGTHCMNVLDHIIFKTLNFQYGFIQFLFTEYFPNDLPSSEQLA